MFNSKKYNQDLIDDVIVESNSKYIIKILRMANILNAFCFIISALMLIGFLNAIRNGITNGTMYNVTVSFIAIFFLTLLLSFTSLLMDRIVLKKIRNDK